MNHHKQSAGRRAFVLLFMFTLLMAAKPLFAQNVSFTADKWEGCAPLTVSFTNLSDNGATAYDWDFGLGAHATTRDAGKVFTTAGTYNVTLTVTYPSGPKSFTKTVTIRDNPVAAFAVSDMKGCTPLTVQFTDQSTPGSGTISKIVWDFGDGNTFEGTNPSHTYNVGGSFSISTIVTNSFGCTNGITQQNLIIVGETPKIDFTSDVFSSCTIPLTVNFRSSGSAGLTYAWDFGDGGTSTDQYPSHTYQQEGRYTVILKAKNAAGCEAIVSKADYITIQKTKADFSVPGPACAGTNVTLVNNTSPRPTLSTWTFPDGSTSSATNAVYYFANAGNYTVTLTSGLPGCMETISKTIAVSPSPKVSFTATPLQSCSVPFTTQFSSQSIGATSWQWTFGDGSTFDGLDPSHTYTRFGDYHVKLRVRNDQGCADSMTLMDYIRIEEPRAVINATPVEGCIPLNSTFSASLLTAGSITGYQWDFGDGATSASPNPSHTFNQEGIFHVKLILDVSGGCRLTQEVIVQAGRVPVVDFDADPKAPCQRFAVNFTNLSTPRGTAWRWNFPQDNNSFETTENPSHYFQNIGLHDVTLEVNNYGCHKSLTKKAFISILPPIADFRIDRNCSDRYTVMFTDLSDFGPVAGTPRSWLWDFGDGTTSTDQSPTHVFPATGTFNIRLTVSNGNCESTRLLTISIIDEKPVLSADKTEICSGMSITFSRSKVDPNNIVNWNWNWGDGYYAPVQGPDVPRTYPRPGDYNVVLTVTDRNGCSSSSNILPVKVNGANADFTFRGRNCKGDTLLFTDASTPSHGYGIRSWTWNFGDGTPNDSLLTAPVDYKHPFGRIGTFNVLLSVIDNAGCHTTITKAVPVTGVTAQFNTATTIACLNQGLQFNNTSTGSNLQYAWDFGDNTTNTAQRPVKTYAQPGTYTVSLAVINNIGCTDTIVKDKYIRVPNPQAKFSVPPDLPVCPPVLVQFTNQSTDFKRSVWDFGDGSRSSLDAPSHVYNLPGKYTITLNVYSDGDCISTTTKEIVIQGPIGTRTMTPNTGCVPHEVTFTATSANAVKYIWDFDNGNVQTTTTNSYKYKYDKEGVYYPRVVLEDAQGCKVPAQGPPDSIIVDIVKAAFTLDDSKACDAGNVVFFNSSTSLSNTRLNKAQTYRWDFGIPGRTDDVSTAASPVFFYNAIGVYQAKMVVTSFYGCKDSLSKTVNVDPLPHSLLRPATPICAGESIRFSGQETKNLPNTRWTWLVDDQPAPVMTGPNPIMTFNTPGQHNVKLIIRNEKGTCPDTASIQATIHPLPTLNVMPKQTVLCYGQSLQLQSNASPAQFSWTNYNISDPASPNPSVHPAKDTTYRVLAINSFGCRQSDSMRVTLSYPFKVRSSDAVICSGKQTQLQATGAVRYRWLPETGLSKADIPNPMAQPSVTTRYRVIGYGSDACFTDTTEVLLTVNPAPVLIPGPERVIPAGTDMPLHVQGSPDIIKWQWYPNQWLSCADCPEPTVTPKGNVTYNITATNQFGCTAIALLPVKLICPGSTAFVPNSFSPNGDGQNDVFYIRGKGISRIKTFKIYNRWGQLIFERDNCNTDDPACGWDGRFGGTLLNPDVYIYYAELVCDTHEPLLLKGNVTLLR